jgi:hypothetical protein
MEMGSQMKNGKGVSKMKSLSWAWYHAPVPASQEAEA